jgi:hypothetical protein
MSTRPVRPRATARALVVRLRSGLDAGMSTAEYAVGTVAACGFAALLWTVLHSDVVSHALSGLITRALGML